MKTLKLLCTGAVLLSLNAGATVRYVNYQSGADSGDGKAAPGWKTLAYAIANADAGDELVLAAGEHKLTTALTVDKALAIRGVGPETRITGKDDGYQNWTKIILSADGSSLRSLMMFKNLAAISSDSTVSNVVFTTGGYDLGLLNAYAASASAGLITSCLITNFVNGCAAGICAQGSAVVENCVVKGNQTKTSNYNWYGRFLDVKGEAGSYVVVRNCTIIDNVQSFLSGRANCPAVYVRGTPANVKMYNNIIWNNKDDQDVLKNFNTGAASYAQWYNNCTTPVDVLPAGNGNIADDPKLLIDRLHLASDSPCRGTAKTGTDEQDVSYVSSVDFEGVTRGATPCIGAMEYVKVKLPMEIASATGPATKRVFYPETLTFTCTVGGDYEEPLTYYWNFDGKGTVTGNTATYALATPGHYHNPTVTVTDKDGQEASATVEGDFAVVQLTDKTYYVDYTNGSDANDGETAGTAWKTLANAVASANEGNTLVLAPGSHPMNSNVTVDRILTITGSGAAIESKSSGYQTVTKMFLTVDGIRLHSLTMKGTVDMSSESLISNVVFTTGGTDLGSRDSFTSVTAGLLTGCCFTNVVNLYNAGVHVGGSAVVENCVFTGNRTTVSGSNQKGYVIEATGADVAKATIRNCTVIDNAFLFESGRVQNPAVRVFETATNVCFYNNIVWNNTNCFGTVVNFVVNQDKYDSWYSNCTTPLSSLPVANRNIDAAPVFVDGDPFNPAIDSPCRNAGNDDLAPKGVDYLGNPRKVGRHVDIGAVEIQREKGLMLIVR